MKLGCCFKHTCRKNQNKIGLNTIPIHLSSTSNNCLQWRALNIKFKFIANLDTNSASIGILNRDINWLSCLQFPSPFTFNNLLRITQTIPIGNPEFAIQSAHSSHIEAILFIISSSSSINFSDAHIYYWNLLKDWQFQALR